jgi:acyl carrier protein phosphodiesterase
MNYLAHAYLSFNRPEILAGNMISDYVKGKKQFEYSSSVQCGIKLHRIIDAFTDNHAATKTIKSYFRPHYRLYAGAFADVVYDYFLATDKNEFGQENDLLLFSQNTYKQLAQFETVFPAKFAAMFPYMQQQNWLYNYRTEWGIQKSFGGLVRRSAYLTDAGMAAEIFAANKNIFQQQYNLFFPAVKKMAAEQLQVLLKT